MPNSYLQYITANNALEKCMSGQKPSVYNAMSAAQQAMVCQKEQQAVSDLLSKDSVGFRNLLQERIAAVKAQQ